MIRDCLYDFYCFWNSFIACLLYVLLVGTCNLIREIMHAIDEVIDISYAVYMMLKELHVSRPGIAKNRE